MRQLLKPLPPGSRVVVVSSGAAINGSPASGGYAGSKATQRFIATYAQEESRRAGLDITVTTVMPRMTPLGEVGREGVRAYAARDGQTEEAYLKQLGELLTPEIAGTALVDLVRADPATIAPSTCSPPPGCRCCHERLEHQNHELEGAERETVWADVVIAAPGAGEFQNETTRTIPVLLLTRIS